LNAASGCLEIAQPIVFMRPAKAGPEIVTKPPEPFSPALFVSLAFNMVSNRAENVCRCDQPEDNGREDFIGYRLSRSLSIKE
jgi:hypothetical protein